MTKELTAAVPLAMKTRSRSIGDEDKERMTRVPAIVPPDGKTSIVGAKDAVLRRSLAESVEVQAQETTGPTLRGAARSRALQERPK